jgi:bacterioferritin-associated ferredoxin
MIVCVCKGVTDRHLEALVAAGAQTTEQVEKLCGAGGDCGACRSEVERIVECGALCASSPSTGSGPDLLVRLRT